MIGVIVRLSLATRFCSSLYPFITNVRLCFIHLLLQQQCVIYFKFKERNSEEKKGVKKKENMEQEDRVYTDENKKTERNTHTHIYIQTSPFPSARGNKPTKGSEGRAKKKNKASSLSSLPHLHRVTCVCAKVKQNLRPVSCSSADHGLGIARYQRGYIE